VRTLHEVHGENALWAGHVHPSVCSHALTRELAEGQECNLVRVLCHWRLTPVRPVEYPKIEWGGGGTKQRMRKIVSWRRIEMMHSGGQSRNYVQN
jgi:hypothetical protein